MRGCLCRSLVFFYTLYEGVFVGQASLYFKKGPLCRHKCFSYFVRGPLCRYMFLMLYMKAFLSVAQMFLIHYTRASLSVTCFSCFNVRASLSVTCVSHTLREGVFISHASFSYFTRGRRCRSFVFLMLCTRPSLSVTCVSHTLREGVCLNLLQFTEFIIYLAPFGFPPHTHLTTQLSSNGEALKIALL